MLKIFIPLIALLASPAFATIITTVNPQSFDQAIKPNTQYKDGVCTVHGALIVANELVAGAHIVIRADRGSSPVAETKTGETGQYSTSFKAKKGSIYQEVVISKPGKGGKISAVPGPTFACGVEK